MVGHLLKKEDFKNIFTEIAYFRNGNNIIVEIGYLEYGAFRFVKFYLVDGEICCVEGRIFINTFNKVQRLLTKLDIKDLPNWLYVGIEIFFDTLIDTIN